VTALRRIAGAANDSRAGSAVRRVLPEPLWRRIAAAAGGRLPEPIDTEPLALLRDVDPAGLEDVLPRLGLADDVPHVLPAELQPHVGAGLKHWQYPNQFAPYLATLAGLPIRSYLEIGVRHGGTFLITVEVLRPDVAVAVDIDRVPALQARPGVDFVQADSRSRRFAKLASSRVWDLVLVDGNHAYDAVRSDVDTVLDHANVIALHDIVDDASPGVRRAWQELKAEPGFTFHEFTAQYDEVVERVGATVLGIGVAVREDWQS
jgi:hypothetical protein